MDRVMVTDSRPIYGRIVMVQAAFVKTRSLALGDGSTVVRGAWGGTGLIPLILTIAVMAAGSPSPAQELKFGVPSALNETEGQPEAELLANYLSNTNGRESHAHIAQ